MPRTERHTPEINYSFHQHTLRKYRHRRGRLGYMEGSPYNNYLLRPGAGVRRTRVGL